MDRERHYPFTTPESKRSFGDSIGASDPKMAVSFYALAALQESDRLEDYHAAREAWKASEPRPVEFVPAEYRGALEALEARLVAEAKADFDAIWGGVLER